MVHDAFLLRRPLEQDWWRGRLNKAWNLLSNECTRLFPSWHYKNSKKFSGQGFQSANTKAKRKLCGLPAQRELCKWACVRKCSNDVSETLRAVNFGQRQRLSMWRALGSQSCFQRCKPAWPQDGSVPKFGLQKCEVPAQFFFFSPFCLLWPVREQDTSLASRTGCLKTLPQQLITAFFDTSVMLNYHTHTTTRSFTSISHLLVRTPMFVQMLWTDKQHSDTKKNGYSHPTHFTKLWRLDAVCKAALFVRSEACGKHS